MDQYPSNFKSGFVAVMGRPNVGKSTLINQLLGTKIAATSPWPQTTRKAQMGILTLEKAQIVFVDTPGFHNPIHKLGERMNQEALQVLEESDIILFLVDISQPPHEEDRLLANALSGIKRSIPILMALNKADIESEEINKKHTFLYQELLPHADTLLISSTLGMNLDQLVQQMIVLLPEGPPFFPEDQLTDLYEREIAADLIRESILFNLRAEIPHSIAVRIDEFKDRDERTTYIAATLFVERDSQKGIVIGQGGERLKKIGIDARLKIEELLGRKVYLQLRVKVRKNWRNDDAALNLFGFKY
ncbi:MAG: GTPase Era [Chloroflexota bacterium]|nr:MAG: GTPase Era [Chloroflexota bacterium]